MRRILGKIYRSMWKYLDSISLFIAKKGNSPKALVLIYHRISDCKKDPYFLSVSPENFENHLELLQTKFNIVSVPELILRIEDKSLNGNELCITFDDGFKDNLTQALPLAKKHRSPITIFITSGFIGKDLYLSRSEVISLSKNGLVTIGSHTINHPRLRDLTPGHQYHQLSESKFDLEKIIGKKIDLVAYPYGGRLDWNRSTLKAAHIVPYKAGFTSIERPIKHGINLLKIPRINVRNYSGDELLRRLSKYK